MEKFETSVLGVMSGTSLDGIDIAYMTFSKGEHWSYKIERAETLEYSEAWKKKLKNALELDDLELQRLDVEYTKYLAAIISKFIEKNSLKDIDALCSHGHTIKHEPENGFTLQIGNLPVLSELVGLKVVCDFRVQDVELGGQGAPLVPIGDLLLFSEYKYCLNLGGFANISIKKDDEIIAYDICPVNTVLNFYAQKMGKEYDAGGKIAGSGKWNMDLQGELEALKFYRKTPPKSLGMEWVNENVFPILKMNDGDTASVMNTFSHHIASQIAKNLDNDPSSKVLITGGGAFNSFLIEQLKNATECELILPSEKIINYKEALIFGLLGVLKMRGEVNVLSSVTGASKDHSSGKIYDA